MAAADYRLMTEATGVRIAEALEAVTAMVGPKGDTGEVSEAELTAKLADKADVIVDTASGAIASFPDGAAVPAKDIVIGIEPVQSGSGDPSPTNVRPISGWTGANVSATGKNLLKNTAASTTVNGVTFTVNSDSSITVNGTATSTIWFAVARNVSLKAGTYTLSGTPSDIPPNCYLYDDTSFATWIDNYGSGAVKTFTSDVTGNIILRVHKDATINNAVFFPMIEIGNSKTSFEPYVGTTIPISFPTEAGTVYGGTLDVTTGVLTVDRAMVDLGMLTWQYEASYRYFKTNSLASVIALPASNFTPIAGLMCSAYKTASAQEAGSGDVDGTIAVDISKGLRIKDLAYTDVSAWKAALADQTIVYPLATPQTYQLTPVEIEMLLGYNNVWADTGDTTVAYRADTKLYIQKINTPTDDDMIADAQIASGRYFIVGGNLYKSTTTIPAGDTITPGSNCILTNLADALNALNT